MNQAVYEGAFLNDKKEGAGVYTWPNGDIYKGAFEQGKPHGNGTKTYVVDEAVVQKLKN